jgi:hypothetical protein
MDGVSYLFVFHFLLGWFFRFRLWQRFGSVRVLTFSPLVDPVTLLYVYMVASVLGYLTFAICVIHDMTHYLGIRALLID